MRSERAQTVADYDIVRAAGWPVLLPAYDAICSLVGLGSGFRAWLVNLARVEPAHRVLDVGCGTGTLAIEVLTRHADVKIDAADPDSDALAIARRKASRKGLEISLHEARAERLQFQDATFDRVFFTRALHHVPEEFKGAALAEIRRITRKDGVSLLADFETTRNSFFRGKHRSLLTLAEALEGAGFEPERVAVRRMVHVYAARPAAHQAN